MFIKALILGMIPAIFAGITFRGIGFLDSQDQLWTTKTAPRGVTRFIKARIIEALLLNLIVATIPAALLFLFINFGLMDTIVIWMYAYASLFGAAMAGIGVSAINPTYDDTQSGAFKLNTFITLLIVMMTSYPGWFIAAIILFHPWVYGLPVAMVIMIAPLLLVGATTVYVGTKRLGRP